jgi:hypothetical protein
MLHARQKSGLSARGTALWPTESPYQDGETGAGCGWFMRIYTLKSLDNFVVVQTDVQTF